MLRADPKFCRTLFTSPTRCLRMPWIVRRQKSLFCTLHLRAVVKSGLELCQRHGVSTSEFLKNNQSLKWNKKNPSKFDSNSSEFFFKLLNLQTQAKKILQNLIYFNMTSMFVTNFKRYKIFNYSHTGILITRWRLIKSSFNFLFFVVR